jgi:hypothetical protein
MYRLKLCGGLLIGKNNFFFGLKNFFSGILARFFPKNLAQVLFFAQKYPPVG